MEITMKIVFQRILLAAFLLASWPALGRGAASRVLAPDAGVRVAHFGTDGNETLMDLGMPDTDVTLQFGRGGDDTLYASSAAAEDWFELCGGTGADRLTAVAGSAKDVVFQSGEDGGDYLLVEAGSDDDWAALSGGADHDELEGKGGWGNDYIYLAGGSGNDAWGTVDIDQGDDQVRINAGDGWDALRYFVSTGLDRVVIEGGAGTDTLTVETGEPQTFMIKNAWGKVIFQRGVGETIITVHGVEHGQVIGQEGQVLFEWWEDGE